MSLWISLGTAAALGATSGVHCAAMCGPIAAVGTSREGRLDARRAFGYLGGRALGYTALGGAAGALGAPFAAGSAGNVVRLVLAILVAAALVYRAIVLVRPTAGEKLVALGRGPREGRFFQKIARYIPRRGMGLGLATALFPCGALFAGVVAASSAGSGPLGAAMMLVFAAASAPLLMLPAALSANVAARISGRFARNVGALALVAAAAWVMTPPIRSMLAPAETPACCASAAGVPAHHAR
ncbi:sulfite exporter TauE/SafE family protein [Polyangium sp. y55x31]|uniref:sulfite exporter TauE/SafE family protein n=1 Tax=Polyangium sp. y55x31 TaxID=3042688 RepID=UPI00248217B9|nr:sulfite exporter TauE/SafE family protein [Polyangium sp. y55x31]MDI1475938.1 sulfite exporter TauE/SafE family protein [Polyangium sp. y55x31]